MQCVRDLFRFSFTSEQDIAGYEDSSLGTFGEGLEAARNRGNYAFDASADLPFE